MTQLSTGKLQDSACRDNQFIKLLPLLGALMGFVLWFFDSLVDVYVFTPDELLIDSLFNDEPTEMWMRVFVVIICISSSLMTQYFLRRQQKIELQLRIHQAEREKHLKELEHSYHELEIAKAEADKANATKSQFLANMSHELRTPLNAIIGYSEILFEDIDGSNNPNQRDDCQRIHVAGLHLLTLINELLDLSKIEAGKTELNIVEFDIREVVDSLLIIMQPLLQRENNILAINYHVDNYILRTDRDKLKQILLNVLGNSAKFTQNDTIELNVSIMNTDFIVIEVVDHGIGISNDKLDTIFCAYESTDRSVEYGKQGTGLGLTISRHLSSLIEADLSLQSVEGQGTTCRLVLPYVLYEEEAFPQKKSA